MIIFRAFFDRDYKYLKVLPLFEDEAKRYELSSKVVYWEDIKSQTEKQAITAAKSIARREQADKKTKVPQEQE